MGSSALPRSASANFLDRHCPAAVRRERVRHCSQTQTSATGNRCPARTNCCVAAAVGARPPPRRRPNVEVQHTDVIVIGNGPSGICLSYLLSGNWPYYNGAGHPDELLTARLRDVDPHQSLLFQDLEYLSDGLEGRTSNPVALLVDALSNPNADVGAQLPSLLRWEFDEQRRIPHVVLGRYDAGGVWQTVEDHVQTLSLAEWMQLPGLSFAEWREQHRWESTGVLDVNANVHASQSHRATAAEVRQYYSDYVGVQGLRPNFINGVVVTSVERTFDDSCIRMDCESGEEVIQCGDERSTRSVVWQVRGYRVVDGPDADEFSREEFCYQAASVVLATGVFDIPNTLHVPGEMHPFVLHSVAELEDRIRHSEVNPFGDPVVVIGAGLSAADAILRARAEGISVVHVFRRNCRDFLSVYRQLPPSLYPEYDVVHRLIRCDGSAVDGYFSYPNATVVDFTASGEVLLRCDGVEGDIVVRASLAVVLIGSRPNLSFMHGDELEIGAVPDMLVSGKHNPVDVNPFTYQSNRRPGLYALGPLVGDSFVRFIRGGAVGVASHLWQQRLKEQSTATLPLKAMTCF